MYISEQIYAETNRSLKRKIRKAKKDGIGYVTLSNDYLETVSKCLDDLWFYYNIEKRKERADGET